MNPRKSEITDAELREALGALRTREELLDALVKVTRERDHFRRRAIARKAELRRLNKDVARWWGGTAWLAANQAKYALWREIEDLKKQLAEAKRA